MLQPKNCAYCKLDIKKLIRNSQKYCTKECCWLDFKGDFNSHTIKDDIVKIYIKDKIVLINTVQLDIVKGYRWYIANNGYATTTRNGKTLFMHHMFLSKEKGLVIDHVNRNKLDNRQLNLRRVTQKVNARNSKVFSTNTSGVKGVIWDKSDNRWVARLVVGNKIMHLGQFKSKEEAIICRRNGEVKYWGENY